MPRLSLSGTDRPFRRRLSLESLENRVCLSAGLPPAPPIDLTPPVETLWSAASGSLPLEETFRLESRPQAARTIYLDFNGHVTTGTAWNRSTGRDRLVSRAWSLDRDRTTWSADERRAVQRIWASVAEDFAPFDVNVTTRRPPVGDLRRSSPADDTWGVRVVIGTDPGVAPGSLGIAYVGSFGWSTDTPAFVFATEPNEVALAVSHEVGHTLGLRHDGTATSVYYTGANGWGPIMGNPLNQPVTQWSRGDYAGGNNREDDLAIMARSGLNLLPDDVGDTVATSAPLTRESTHRLVAAGRIGSPGDRDLFRFEGAAGPLRLNVEALPGNANLNVGLTLLDSGGTVIAAADPTGDLDASLRLTLPRTDTYTLIVDGTPLRESGVTTDYGSLGYYRVRADVPTPPVSGASPGLAPVTAQPSVVPSVSGASEPQATLLSTNRFESRRRRQISAGRPTTVVSSIYVRNLSGPLEDAVVRVNIEHTWVGDLELWLESPDGRRTLLSRRRGGNSDDAYVEFRADATASVKDATRLRGPLRPEQDLRRLRGIDPNGRWRLIVRDRAYRDGGQLRSWSLELKNRPPLRAERLASLSNDDSATARRPSSRPQSGRLRAASDHDHRRDDLAGDPAAARRVSVPGSDSDPVPESVRVRLRRRLAAVDAATRQLAGSDHGVGEPEDLLNWLSMRSSSRGT